MRNLVNYIIETAKKLKVAFIELPQSGGEEIFNKIKKKYEESDRGTFLWENFPEGVSIQNENAWEWIDDILGEEETIMFFSPRKETAGLTFFNGKDIVKVLGETSHFEFYLTNKTLDYVLCFNHHDFLMVCGRLEEKFRKFLKSKSLLKATSHSKS